MEHGKACPDGFLLVVVPLVKRTAAFGADAVFFRLVVEKVIGCAAVPADAPAGHPPDDRFVVGLNGHDPVDPGSHAAERLRLSHGAGISVQDIPLFAVGL